jgi:hypothetical protein
VARDSVALHVTSFGNQCTIAGPDIVGGSGTERVVRPYDNPNVHDPAGCVDVLTSLPHDVRLVFADTGVAVVRVVGNDWRYRHITISRYIHIVPR